MICIWTPPSKKEQKMYKPQLNQSCQTSTGPGVNWTEGFTSGKIQLHDFSLKFVACVKWEETDKSKLVLSIYLKKKRKVFDKSQKQFVGSSSIKSCKVPGFIIRSWGKYYTCAIGQALSCAAHLILWKLMKHYWG